MEKNKLKEIVSPVENDEVKLIKKSELNKLINQKGEYAEFSKRSALLTNVIEILKDLKIEDEKLHEEEISQNISNKIIGNLTKDTDMEKLSQSLENVSPEQYEQIKKIIFSSKDDNSND